MEKHIRITAWLLILGLCTTFSGCSFSNDIRNRTEYFKRQEAMLSEDTGWIETNSRLGMVVTDLTDYAEEDKKFKYIMSFRMFDFPAGTYTDHKINLDDSMQLIPCSEGIGFSILESGSKHDMLYEVLDDLSIGRKAELKQENARDIYALVDDIIYYTLDTDPEFFGEWVPVRQNLTTGKITKLDVNDIFSISKTHNILGERQMSIDRLAKDGQTTIVETIHELGILSPENKWTSIVKAGWGYPFDVIESACWLDENRALISLSRAEEHESSMYIYDVEKQALSRLVNDRGVPIYLYNRYTVDTTMYPDPSGEYVAYFMTDHTGKVEDLHSVYILSLKSGQISQIESYAYTDSETENTFHSLRSDMLIWM